ncbi:MAG: hypothetical protein LBO00_00590 [Zoogloeaceae bacterium]|jgi:hypothetical protein|nr:hypothetical protein [Zoogloeaceae bacterium]
MNRNKNLGSLIFLAGFLLLASIALLLSQQPVAPGVRFGGAPLPVSAQRTQLESDLAKTRAVLARLQTLDLRKTAAYVPLADVFPELADAAAPLSAEGAGVSMESGYNVPITRREDAARLPGAATSSVSAGSLPSGGAAAQGDMANAPDRLVLTYVTSDLRRAMIGERIVHVGDVLENGARVVAIGDAFVDFIDAGGRRVQLRLTTARGGQP